MPSLITTEIENFLFNNNYENRVRIKVVNSFTKPLKDDFHAILTLNLDYTNTVIIKIGKDVYFADEAEAWIEVLNEEDKIKLNDFINELNEC